MRRLLELAYAFVALLVAISIPALLVVLVAWLLNRTTGPACAPVAVLAVLGGKSIRPLFHSFYAKGQTR